MSKGEKEGTTQAEEGCLLGAPAALSHRHSHGGQSTAPGARGSSAPAVGGVQGFSLPLSQPSPHALSPSTCNTLISSWPDQSQLVQ